MFLLHSALQGHRQVWNIFGWSEVKYIHNLHMILLIVLFFPSYFITDHHFFQAHKSSRKYHSHGGLAGEPHRNSKEENWQWQKLNSSQKFSKRKGVVSKKGEWRDNTKSSVVFQAGIGDFLLVMVLYISKDYRFFARIYKWLLTFWRIIGGVFLQKFINSKHKWKGGTL